MAEKPSLFASGRRDKICDLVSQRGECTVAELSEALGVSGMTIRRDLQYLAEHGKIIRTHGGATKTERVSFEFSFLYRIRENLREKEAIAGVAAALVQDSQSILLDSGTTTLALAKQLRSKTSLTVITTSLPIAAELQNDTQIRVLVLGGYLRPASPDLYGAVTELTLESLHAEYAFLGADAIDENGDVYNRSPEVARLLQKMAAAADRVFVVADHTKLGKRALAKFGSLREWAGLITDRSGSPGLIAALRGAGVRVTMAPASKIS
jgi:DeoR/GlpR family transcriptional regulator of sugar metabolism